PHWACGRVAAAFWMSSSPIWPATRMGNAAAPTAIVTPGAVTAGAWRDGRRRGDLRLRLRARRDGMSLSGRAAGEADRPALRARALEPDRQPRHRQVQRAPEPPRRRELLDLGHAAGRSRGGGADRARGPSRDPAPGRVLPDGARPGAL